MQFDQLMRREFITLVGGASAMSPCVPRAQQKARMRHIGVLSTVAADDPEVQSRMAAFHQGLQEAGWVVGRNVRIDYRLSRAGDSEQSRRYAAELVALALDVILAVATAAVGALQQATHTTPIVFVQVTETLPKNLANPTDGRVRTVTTFIACRPRILWSFPLRMQFPVEGLPGREASLGRRTGRGAAQRRAVLMRELLPAKLKEADRGAGLLIYILVADGNRLKHGLAVRSQRALHARGVTSPCH
jgi:ABC transporter substrate binding protein